MWRESLHGHQPPVLVSHCPNARPRSLNLSGQLRHLVDFGRAVEPDSKVNLYQSLHPPRKEGPDLVFSYPDLAVFAFNKTHF